MSLISTTFLLKMGFFLLKDTHGSKTKNIVNISQAITICFFNKKMYRLTI